jgi:hypothetical protein
MPSMIEAWFNCSEMTASSSSSSALKRSQHDEKRIVSSVPRKAESRSSRKGEAATLAVV